MQSRYKFLFLPLFILSLSMLLTVPNVLFSQSSGAWAQDFRNMMEIDDILTIESSPAHLYVLSEQEGLVVFRANSDTLQWLYSSTGMERRGTRLQTDVRFAYLYDDSRRLTVVEPTSVLGVYTSTSLPEQPLSVQRLGNRIYIAMGDYGLGSLSLESPEAVDTEPEILFEELIDDHRIIDLVSDHASRLYVLTDRHHLFLFDRVDAEENIEHNRTVELDSPATKVFLTNNELIGADGNGRIFLIDSGGRTDEIADVQEPVTKIGTWNDNIVVRTEGGRLWIGEFGSQPQLWKEDPAADNFFAVVNGNLWVSNFNQISTIVPASTDASDGAYSDANQKPEINPIDDVTIPFPRPVIIPLEFSGNQDLNDVEFSYRSNVRNAGIRGQSFYWQPTSSQIGRHRFTISATNSTGRIDTTEFSVDIRPFNTPPRFTPLQQVTINVDEEFTLEINAIDPDGMDPNLIRYLGVDLPDGATLDEQTGEFTWRPNIRQVGEFEFQVIATDQFGAASSKDVEIRVIETDPEEEADIDTD